MNYGLVLFLVLLGLGIAWLRHQQMEIPFTPGEERTVWTIEARIDFVARGEPVLASLGLPGAPPGFRLHSGRAVSPGYGFSIVERGGVRRGEWTRRRAEGLQTLYYTVQMIDSEAAAAEGDEPLPEPEAVYWEEPQATAAGELLERALALSSTPESLLRELVKLVAEESAGQNAALLLEEEGERSRLLVKLLNSAGIPARLAEGLPLEDARRRQPLISLVEVHTEQGWQLFDPLTGRPGLPENLLLWSRGEESLLEVQGGSGSQVSFSMIRQNVPALALAGTKESGSVFSLLGVQRLPIEEQGMFKLLFLLPLGAAVVVFMRIVIGLKTSGTFMPVLIALAFLQTQLLPGLISFVLVVALGLLLRSYLAYLNLLLVARIATLVVLVVFLISLLSLAGYQLGLNTGMTITFFPMIIIAWTIERMSILWEEEGPREVLLQGGGSLLVAVLAYLLMSLPLAGHLSFNFPELNLALLGLIVAMGQYTGYKLLELRRFRSMEMEIAGEAS